jgi:hypothetical protein
MTSCERWVNPLRMHSGQLRLWTEKDISKSNLSKSKLNKKKNQKKIKDSGIRNHELTSFHHKMSKNVSIDNSHKVKLKN